MGKKLQMLLAAGGILLLVWMAERLGFDAIRASLAQFGLGAVLFLIAVYALAQAAFCAAWYVLLLPGSGLGFGRTFLAYAAGDAVNMTVPSGNLAGEPVKVMLVSDRMGTEAAVASVTVYKVADFVSLTLFLSAGWAFHFWFYTLPIVWNAGAAIVASGMAAACFLIFYLLKRGLYHPAGRWLGRIGLFESWIEKKLESAHLIDQGIREFYDRHPLKFLASVGFNFLAWFGGVLEILIFMRLSGVEPSFPAAVTVETFSLFINNVTFFVPARIGVGEGGRVLLFQALGYPAVLGLSYGIVRRIREAAWIALGFMILPLYKPGAPTLEARRPRHDSPESS